LAKVFVVPCQQVLHDCFWTFYECPVLAHFWVSSWECWYFNCCHSWLLVLASYEMLFVKHSFELFFSLRMFHRTSGLDLSPFRLLRSIWRSCLSSWCFRDSLMTTHLYDHAAHRALLISVTPFGVKEDGWVVPRTYR
jgi:hypothetical protein